MVAAWALVVLACIWIVVALLVLVGVGVYLVRSRGEEADTPADDLMAVADAVSDDHYAEDYALLNKVAPGLEGFTPLEAETLQRNYLPMTDDERFRLDMAWRSIVDGERAQP